MKHHKLIKVCGMTEGRNVYEIEQLGVDLIGFIFYAESPRHLHKFPTYLPQVAGSVGVFVNENEAYIQKTVEQYALDYVQLHGCESVEYCRNLHSAGFKMIKNFAIASEKDLQLTSAYEGLCDYFLFDTPCGSYGGSGVQFDWNILNKYNGTTPFLLSGGIAPNSVNALKNFHHPQLAGYDINSRFETEPGKKNVIQIAQFIKNINHNE